MRVITFNTLSSTNDYLKEHISAFDEAICIHALHQTNGRGRRGRTWKAKNGENLLVSIYHPSISTNARALWISILSVIKTLSDYDISADIKLPNDILVDNRKIAGILIEHLRGKQKIIAGVGFNVNEVFEDVFLNASSLKFLTGDNHDINDIRDELLGHFETLIQYSDAELLEIFKTQLFKKKIRAFLGDKGVVVRDIDENFNCKINEEWMSCDNLEFVPPLSEE